MGCRAFIGGLAVLALWGCESGDRFGEPEGGDSDAGEQVALSSMDGWVVDWLEHET